MHVPPIYDKFAIMSLSLFVNLLTSNTHGVPILSPQSLYFPLLISDTNKFYRFLFSQAWFRLIIINVIYVKHA